MSSLAIFVFIYISTISTVCQASYSKYKDDGINGLENSPLTEAWALVGGHVLLPCNMDPPVANDSTHLVLFYYGDAGTPIYSLDSRGSQLESATHWADASVVSRAFVRTDRGNRGLLLEEVTLRDQGHYRCRVDFLESPTRNSRIKLIVVIPPTRVQISSNMDQGHDLRGIVGPYTLGTEVIYTCQATGGTPRPRVAWYEGDVLLDNISEVMKGPLTSNELYQPPLGRFDFNKTLTCLVSNSDLVKPLTASISIDINYPPTLVLVDEGNTEVVLREGVAKRISCDVIGSRPRAKVIWRMGDRRISDMNGAVEEEFLRGGRTRSIFTYVGGVGDNGVVLGCSAYNPSLPHVVLRNTTKLSVLYKPRMQLRPDSNLYLEDLREGVDVTLRCLVDANPTVTGVQWAHNDVPIQAVIGHKTEVTQGTLSLRSISRASSGNYTCAAANTEGATTSNSLILEVRFPPVCASGQQTVFGAARHEELHVPCRVEAHPAPTSFRWAVNTTTGLVDIALSHSSRRGTSTSVVRYTPQTHLDFGQLLCWGNNDVSSQRNPCVFNIIPAAKPEAVKDCEVQRNTTMPPTYAVLTCSAGWGGGLNQSFTLEIRQQATEAVLEKFSLAASPTFVVTGLKLGVPYLLTVTAANSRGSSPPVTMPYMPPKVSADKVISPPVEEPPYSYTPLILVIVGVLVAIAACVLVGVYVTRKKRWRRRHSQHIDRLPDDTSLKDLREMNEIPSVTCMNKEMKRKQSIVEQESPEPRYVEPGPMLSNSCMSLDDEVMYLKEKLAVYEGKAPLARTDSIEGVSMCSSMRFSTSRPSSFRSHNSAPLNPDHLMREDYLRRDNYLTKSNYLTLENYLPPSRYLTSHHHLAQSDNFLGGNYYRNDMDDPFDMPPPLPPPLPAICTLPHKRRAHPSPMPANHTTTLPHKRKGPLPI